MSIGAGGLAATSNQWFQPVILDYNLTATNLVLIGSFTATTAVSLTVNVAAYTVSGNSLSRASTASAQIVGASTATGNQYVNVSLPTWAFTAGFYVIGFAFEAMSGTISLYTPLFTNAAVNASSTVTFPAFGVVQSALGGGGTFLASIALTNSVYNRAGTLALQQPWFLLQGT